MEHCRCSWPPIQGLDAAYRPYLQAGLQHLKLLTYGRGTSLWKGCLSLEVLAITSLPICWELKLWVEKISSCMVPTVQWNASCSIITCFHRSKVLNVRSYWSFSDKMRQSRYGGSAPNVCPGMNLVVHHLHTCVCFKHIVLINMFDCFRMPVQYVIEEWDFRDLTLKMRPPVFIPRPETEVFSQKICAQDSSNHQWSNRFFYFVLF